MLCETFMDTTQDLFPSIPDDKKQTSPGTPGRAFVHAFTC